ncbi:MAG: DNA ligase [SAR86 cluster bacterium]|jgi:DNA ligase (NAD+)|nr:DNA ligase [SAR86 cluster bacterium]
MKRESNLDLNDLEINQIIELLEGFNKSYRQGTPEITDEEYDRIYIHLKSLSPNDKYFENIEKEEEETFSSKKVQHSQQMLSIDKAYSIEDIEKYLVRVTKFAKNTKNQKFLIKATAKLDGMAGNYEENKLLTRGDGEYGFDITKILKQGVKSIGGKNTGLGEIVLDLNFFNKHLSQKFSHPRNVIVGIAGSDKINDEAQKALKAGAVHFIPHSSLTGWEGNSEDLMENFYSIMNKVKVSDFPTDGVVLEVLDDEIKQLMGSTNHHYNWQIAYKEKGETANCNVASISWQLGRTGRCTPVLNVSETELSGAKIKRVTAHHAGMIKKLGLGKGAVIEIIRSGEVIPKIVNVIKKSKDFKMIKSCPSCGSSLIWQNDFLVCIDHKNCPEQQIASLVHFFNILGNVDLFGNRTIEKLYKGSFDSLEKIYSMKKQDFEDLGFGPKQSSNAIEQLIRSRQEEIDDWRFLAAFGLQYLGIGESKRLLKAFPLSELNKLKVEEIQNLSGFGPIASPVIVEEINQLWATINKLLDFRFKLRMTDTNSIKALASSPISNKRIIFTGKMKSSREGMQENASTLGASIQTSVNKKTDILVVGENVGEKKLELAKTLGIKILSESEYYDLIK